MTSIFDLYKPSSQNFTGGIAEYLVEHKQPGANIINLDDALWWSVITITTIGYGDYTPISPLGRTIAVIVMFAGIGIAVTLVGIISQNRLQRMQERLKSKAEGKARALACGFHYHHLFQL
jgi:voltage-gated potassium channel Kch